MRRGNLISVGSRCGTEGADAAASGAAVGRVKSHGVGRFGVGADPVPPAMRGRRERGKDASGRRSTRHVRKRCFH